MDDLSVNLTVGRASVHWRIYQQPRCLRNIQRAFRLPDLGDYIYMLYDQSWPDIHNTALWFLGDNSLGSGRTKDTRNHLTALSMQRRALSVLLATSRLKGIALHFRE